MILRKFPEDLNGLAWESIKSMDWNTKVQKKGITNTLAEDYIRLWN